MSHSVDRQPIRIETLDQYFREYHEVRKTIEKYPGIWRCLGTFKFNVEFFNKTFYSTFKPTGNFIQAEYETNRPEDNEILNDILTFCMSTDITNQLGLSVADFLELDPVTYKQIKDKFEEMDKPRKKALREVQQQMQSPNGGRQNYDNIKERLADEQRRYGSRRGR